MKKKVTGNILQSNPDLGIKLVLCLFLGIIAMIDASAYGHEKESSLFPNNKKPQTS